jgi:beta-galactosidase
MKKIISVLTGGLLFLVACSSVYAQSDFKIEGDFNSPQLKYEKIGRGEITVAGTVLTSKDAYAAFGENSWANYEIAFSARVPETADQVQICAGFRAGNRDDRYFLMLKGGIQKNLYLARLGYMGSDDFLALRQLDFQPVPGKWYDFKVQVAGNRIRIFLNNEKLPRIDVADKSSNLAPSGKVTLGGCWIPNEFNHFSVRSIKSNDLPGSTEEYAVAPVNKEKERKAERAAYKPIVVNNICGPRTQLSLDGKWLFSPGYEIDDEKEAIMPDQDDKSWHVMTVPNFWNPLLVWLYGERYNTASKGTSDNYFQKEMDRCSAYTFDYKKTTIGWYRQWLELPANIKGKDLELSFDAVSKVADVWVNGVKAGSHVGMFGDFKVNATGLLKPGKNLITVEVTRDYVKDIKDANKVMGVAVTVEVTQKMLKDIAHGFLDEDPAGIWQPVSLIITDPVKIEDVFIKSNLSGADIDVTVKNNSADAKSFSLTTGITGDKLKDELYRDISLKQLQLQGGEEKTFTYTISNLKPKLWSPDHPNLYNFDFKLVDNQTTLDDKVIRSGFRTFKIAGGFFYLNGKRYWLRGGNQTAMPLAPNDTTLANKFCSLMKAGNIMITRTHTVPFDETWLNAADEHGIGVSYEGTWPWLFLGSSMPDMHLVDLWKNEFYDIIKKYRNHPSILIWTMNNEMKFYSNDPDIERAKIKMKVISDVVKHMRTIDPNRPIVFDSNYERNTKRFGADFYKDIDDGDIDDTHAYPNWYTGSVFKEFNGEWQKRVKNEGRPLISQEMSTGYTDETGHATRYYNYVHQNPESLAGKYTYEFNDPNYFMIPQTFISKELAEALRRSNDRAAGVLHFSASTWFSNVYDANKITPFPVYYAMKTALQPVLVSAELWGRHFYAGDDIPARICVINDKEDGSVLNASELGWKLVNKEGNVIAEGKEPLPSIEVYGREWVSPKITIPKNLAQSRIYGKLLLSLVENGKQVSENSYDLLFETRNGLDANKLAGKKIIAFDPGKKISSTLDFLGIKYAAAPSLADAVKQSADIYILSGLDTTNTSAAEVANLRKLIANGGKVFISNSGNFGHMLYPEYIRSVVNENGEIMMMDIPESDVFNGIEPLDTRYFNNNKRESPAVTTGAFRINRSPNLEALASFISVHAYLSGPINARMNQLDKIKGFPIVRIKDNGNVLLSEVQVGKANTDPVAAKLLVNMLSDLAK